MKQIWPFVVIVGLIAWIAFSDRPEAGEDLRLWSGVIATGVLGSILGGLLLYLATARDRKIRTASFEQLQEDVSDLLKALPRALGGDFTKSLWSYHPESSQGIVEVLGNYAGKAYEEYGRRSLVDKGKDLYRLEGVEKIEWEDKAATPVDVWSLTLHIEWSWRNDSKKDKSPLKNFAVLVVATPQVIPVFTYQVGGESTVDAYKKALENYPNRLMVAVANPRDPESKIPNPELVNSLFELTDLRFVYHGSRLEVEASDLEVDRTLKAEDRPGIYHVMKISEAKGGFVLPAGEVLQGEYKAKLKIPITRGDGGAKTGKIVYYPSDIVKDEFLLALNYPSIIKCEKDRYGIKVDPNRSFCENLQEIKTVFAKEETTQNGRFPEAFQPTGGRKLHYVEVGESLTHLHLLSLSWEAKKTATLE